ncbi:MAG: DUF4350 domain-containing protein [Sphingobium sp.]
MPEAFHGPEAAARHGRRALFAALLTALLAFCLLLSGFLPLAMPFGLAIGGVLETGQAEPMRWWPGGLLVLAAGLALCWRWPWRMRLYWLAVLAAASLSAILIFTFHASAGQNRADGGKATEGAGEGERPVVALLTALPLLWSEGRDIADMLHRGEGARDFPPAPVTSHRVMAIDHIDRASLAQAGVVLVAQPRLLQPRELVELDRWVRAGGRAVILADPLLVWPSDLSPGDPRRPPLTSLLDPLLAHWGLRLEPAAHAEPEPERRMLASGHVLLLAGASRFTVTGEGKDCALTEQGLMALCRIGKGRVRLVADADLLDERLWLADRRWPGRSEAWSADIPALLDGWLVDPLGERAMSAPPRRVVDEAALVKAMRGGLLAILVWAGLGWAGHRWIFGRSTGAIGRRKEDKGRTCPKPDQKEEGANS